VKRIAIYPGTFDPVTNGHLDLVDRGRRHFDRVIVAILRNEDKQPMFAIEERMSLLREALRGRDDVEVDTFDGLLVDYARRVGATVIVRGSRDHRSRVRDADGDDEPQARARARDRLPAAERDLLLRLEPPRARGGASRGSVDGLVPSSVARALAALFPPSAPSA